MAAHLLHSLVSGTCSQFVLYWSLPVSFLKRASHLPVVRVRGWVEVGGGGGEGGGIDKARAKICLWFPARLYSARRGCATASRTRRCCRTSTLSSRRSSPSFHRSRPSLRASWVSRMAAAGHSQQTVCFPVKGQCTEVGFKMMISWLLTLRVSSKHRVELSSVRRKRYLWCQ